MPDQAPERKTDVRDVYALLVEVAREAVVANRELTPPREGDLVVEMTNRRYDPEGIGWLENIYPYAPNLYNYEVRSLMTGETHHWDNSDFRRVPSDKAAELAGRVSRG
jgi:hypothetical protein